jgi:hypothetical protein
MRRPIPSSLPIWSLRVSAAFAAALAVAVAPLAARAADPMSLAKPKGFDDAVAALERATGVKGEQAELGGKAVPLAEGRAFAVDGATAGRLLAGSHDAMREAGLYLFRLERSSGASGRAARSPARRTRRSSRGSMRSRRTSRSS